MAVISKVDITSTRASCLNADRCCSYSHASKRRPANLAMWKALRRSLGAQTHSAGYRHVATVRDVIAQLVVFALRISRVGSCQKGVLGLVSAGVARRIVGRTDLNGQTYHFGR